MIWSNEGFLIPKTEKPELISEESLKVCPFNPFPDEEVRTENEIADIFLKDAPNRHPRVGHYYNTYVGYSNKYRLTSSSGGIATYLIDVLLDKKIVDAVHDNGAKIFGQLTHFGNQTRSAETFQPLWAPSNIPDFTIGEIPEPMNIETIHILVDSFASSAMNLIEAGFDGVEIKVAHDGILGQFLSLVKNVREDDYGGRPKTGAELLLRHYRR